MYQSGTLCWCITSSSFISLPLFLSLYIWRPLPFRTCSIIWKLTCGSMPLCIRYTIMSSRVQIAVEIVHLPSSINVWAFPSHTSVPWDKPDMLTRSEILVGFVSTSIWITKSVPSSGSPNEPVGHPSISSDVIPSASGPVNKDITFGSLIGTSLLTLVFVNFSRRLIIVGSSCPRISSFNKLASMAWYSKWVVIISVVISFAGFWIGVNSYISLSLGTITIPPGCCPVLLRIPWHPLEIRSISAVRFICPCSS